LGFYTKISNTLYTKDSTHHLLDTGWYWIICEDYNDPWNTDLFQGAGGSDSPLGIKYTPISSYAGVSGYVDVIDSSSNAKMPEAIATNGSIFTQESFKTYRGLEIKNYLAFGKNSNIDHGGILIINNPVDTYFSIAHAVRGSLLSINTSGSIIADSCILSGIVSPKTLVTKEYVDDITSSSITNISGTVDQIYVSTNIENTTLSLPQNIAPSSHPTFEKVSITSYPILPNDAVNLQAMIDAFSTQKFKGDVNAYLSDPLVNLSGYAIIDGVNVNEFGVVLRNVNSLYDQNNNGLWKVNLGLWERTLDFNEWNEIQQATVVVTGGNTYSGTRWYCNAPLIGTIDVDPITFIELSSGGTVGEAPIDGKIYGRKDASWSNIIGTITLGDIKSGLQLLDHNGWIKLDGRAISTLTTTQQAEAIALGLSTTLPNATGAIPIQNGTTLGSVTGSMSRTITQANLPNVNLTAAANGAHTHTATGANTSSAGAHEHTLTCFRSNGSAIEYGLVGLATDIDKFANIRTADSAGEHTHTVSFTLANSVTHTHTTPLGGAGTALDITPKTFNINYFIYLGV